MPQYFSPGVYIQEVETGPVPIQGVATSITGAVGVTAQGPTSGKPILVTSFNDFQSTFGSFLKPPPDSQLNEWLDPVEGGAWWQFPLSVKGYFDNGGQQLYVKRVFSGQAQAASGSLGQGLTADLSAASAATDTTLQLAHTFRIAKTGAGTPPAQPVTIIVNGSPIAPPATPPATAGIPTAFQVLWYDPSSRKVGLSAAPNQALKAGRDLVVITPLQPATVAANVGLKFSAQAKGGWGNSIAVRVSPVLGATLSILPDTVNGGPTFSGSVVSAMAVFTITVLVPQGKTIGQTVIINNQSYPVVLPPSATRSTPAGSGTGSTPAGSGTGSTPAGSGTGSTPAGSGTGSTPAGSGTGSPPAGSGTGTPPAGTGTGTPPAGSGTASTSTSNGTPTTFTVLANVSDGLQSLGGSTLVAIFPITGSTNVTAQIQSIVGPPANAVTLTLNSALPSGVGNVLIQGRIYPITAVSPPTTGAFLYTINPDQLSWAAWPANVAILSVRKRG